MSAALLALLAARTLARGASPLCRGDVAALVTDGANTVCDRFVAAPELLVAAALVVAFVFVWRARPRVRDYFLRAAVVLSVPGFYALAVQRADAPTAVSRTAARLARVERGLEDDARTHGCVASAPGACEACQPIARFARARPGVCVREPAAGATRGDGTGTRCDPEDLGCLAP